jgi:hypothetical protein
MTGTPITVAEARAPSAYPPDLRLLRVCNCKQSG